MFVVYELQDTYITEKDARQPCISLLERGGAAVSRWRAFHRGNDEEKSSTNYMYNVKWAIRKVTMNTTYNTNEIC